ncbi:hypothetical protein D3C87_898870 [compost metagenome]
MAIPVEVTVLPVPTLAVAKLAVPPVRLTSATSTANTPVKVLVKIAALVLPS